MSQQQGGPPQTTDDQAFVILIFGFITLAILVWWLSTQGPFFNTVAGATAYVFLYPWYLAVEHFPGLTSIPILGFYLFNRPHDIVGFLSEGGYVLMNGQQLVYLTSTLGYIAGLYFMPFLGYLTYAGTQVRGDLRYVGQMGLEELIKHHAKFWRTTRFLVHFKPVDQKSFDIRQANDAMGKQKHVFEKGDVSNMLHVAPKPVPSPTWSRSVRPEEWLVTQGCTFDFDAWRRLQVQDLTTPEQFEHRDQWKSKSIQDYDEVFRRAFAEPWSGVDALPPTLKALFAVSVFFYEFEQDRGQKLLDALGLLAARNNCNREAIENAILADTGIQSAIKDAQGKRGAKILTNFANQHAWTITAIQRVVEEGKKGRGILASAQFNWMKGVDRKMWYIFNGLGGEVASVEAAAAAAHYRAERQIGVPLLHPVVRQVSRSLLEEYLDMNPDRQEVKRFKAERQMTPAEKIAHRLQSRNST